VITPDKPTIKRVEIMKRSLVILVTLALFLAACSTVVAPPTTKGVVTAVNGDTITVGSQTYTIDNRTSIYAPDGNQLRRSFLTNGQTVQVWANGEKAVRINVES
jgi:hypothetical protein